MVWEQQVVIVVMITNLIERGRRKCDMYWPKEGTEVYGVISVTLTDENVLATYTVRTFKIKHLKLKKKKGLSAEKTVYQYHYTTWPDHGMYLFIIIIDNSLSFNKLLNITELQSIFLNHTKIRKHCFSFLL